jgi:hypothetical protein
MQAWHRRQVGDAVQASGQLRRADREDDIAAKRDGVALAGGVLEEQAEVERLALQVGRRLERVDRDVGLRVGRMRTRSGAAPARNACTASPSMSKAELNLASTSPARAVGATPWARRSNSLAPAQASSDLMCWATAPGVTHSSSAAAEKLPWRAAASKARKALSGGPGGRGGVTDMELALVFLRVDFSKTGLRVKARLWLCIRHAVVVPGQTLPGYLQERTANVRHRFIPP